MNVQDCNVEVTCTTNVHVQFCWMKNRHVITVPSSLCCSEQEAEGTDSVGLFLKGVGVKGQGLSLNLVQHSHWDKVIRVEWLKARSQGHSDLRRLFGSYHDVTGTTTKEKLIFHTIPDKQGCDLQQAYLLLKFILWKQWKRKTRETWGWDG